MTPRNVGQLIDIPVSTGGKKRKLVFVSRDKVKRVVADSAGCAEEKSVAWLPDPKRSRRRTAAPNNNDKRDNQHPNQAIDAVKQTAMSGDNCPDL